MNSRTRADRPDPHLYLPIRGQTRGQRTIEQDTAAGTRADRFVPREDGSTVLGSVALRCYPESRRVYAYLRWSSGLRRTAELYLGDVSDCPDRATALHEAWVRVPNRGKPATTTASSGAN